MRIVAAGGADISITSPLQAAGADALTNSTSGIPTYDLLSGFNGATWDRLRALGDDSDGVATASLGRLLALARLSGYNGASWDRLLSKGNNSDAVANTTLGNLQTLGFPHGFNGSTWDRLRSLGGTSLDGLGQLSVASAIPGAGVVTGFADTPASSTTRATLITPTSGKRIRVIVFQLSVAQAGASGSTEIYFGTGANIETAPAKAIGQVAVRAATWGGLAPFFGDGSGPVGAVDDVLSYRTNATAVDTVQLTIIYREE